MFMLHTTITSPAASMRAFGCAANYADVVQSGPCCNSEMHRWVLRSANYLQILWRVIRCILIDVVGVITGWRVCHNTVFIAPFSISAFDFDVAVIANLFRSYRFSFRVIGFSKTLCQAFTPVLTTVSGDEARIYGDASGCRRNIWLNLFIAPARTNFDCCSRASFHC